MVEVVVDYDYTAKEPDEISIKKGDVIKDVVKKAGGWWEGSLNGKKGMFPDNFVRVLDKDMVTYRNKSDVARIRQCRVVFSYKQDHQDELNLSVGDIITILGEEEEGWWRGALNGKEGVFPSNFVDEIKSKPGSREDLNNVNESNDVKIPLLPPKPIKTLCQVRFAYKAQNEDELTIKEGDVINLISKDGVDVGWWKGELNGRVGVFPDNFVTLVTENELKTQGDKINKVLDSTISKTPVVSSQRKSLEDKQDKSEVDGVARVTPPIPSKKPLIPIKKSPSGSGGSQGGLLAGLRKKLVDVVDGATGSKSQPVLIKATEIKEDPKSVVLPENAFDQVERTPMLSDVRATRAKAPGRRPPSVVFKDGEPGVVNGNTDHIALDSLAENSPNSRSSSSSEHPDEEARPRVREWEKHKAPWLEEMKMNQAKRTSTSPGPENKLKLVPSDKNVSPEIEEAKSTKTTGISIEMSKSMSSISSKVKTNVSETESKTSVVLRSKPIPQTSARPQSIHSVAVTNLNDTQKHFNVSHITTPPPKVSPNHSNKTTSPSAKPPIFDSKPAVDGLSDNSTSKLYNELLQRIERLEVVIEQQNSAHKAAIEELKGKLQLETEMRRLLQAELDKVSQCVLQV